MAWSDRNVAAGGQVYDRNTGTWVGETRGSVGDGIDHGRSGDLSRVIHDANGPVGVQFASPALPSGPAAGVTSNGVKQAGNASVAGAISGPGAPAVATVTGGKQPTASNRGAFLDQMPVALGFDQPSLVMPLVAGGRRLAHDQGWSNIADWEERTGESELLSPTWFASWGVAGADAWANLSVDHGGPVRTKKVQADLWNAPGVIRDAVPSFFSFADEQKVQRAVNQAAAAAGQQVTSWGIHGFTATQPYPPDLNPPIFPGGLLGPVGVR